MDIFDRVLPKPVRPEQFFFYNERAPDQLVQDMNKVFASTRGFVFSPNLAGEFMSAYTFRAQPKWSLIFIRGGGTAVRMKGEVTPQGSGSLITIRLLANWTFALFVLFPPSLVLLWLIMVPKDRLPEFPSEDLLAPIGLLVFFPTCALLTAWIAKRRFKQNFIRHFQLTPLKPAS